MCFRMSVPVKWQEEQAICCAGLTRPKPNVFQQAVQYLLVVCTTVEVCSQGKLSVVLPLLPPASPTKLLTSVYCINALSDSILSRYARAVLMST